MEGKRTRTMSTASYRDDDARSESDDGPEDLFKLQKDEESSSEECAHEPIAKKKVPPPPQPCCTYLFLPPQKVTAKKVNGTQCLPTQKCGNAAIGVAVTRDFGAEGNFTGTIIAVRKMGSTHIYTVQYTDGDVEELNKEEYTCAYALWLRESGEGLQS